MPSTPSGQIFDASKIARLFPVMDNIEKQVEFLDSPAPQSYTLTSRKLDESQPAGLRTYIKAAGLIRAGFDNMNAFKLVLEQRLTAWAPWTLIRTVFETGFWALWILEPSDGAERRKRGLHLSVLDQKEWKNWADSLTIHSAQARQEVDNRDIKDTNEFLTEAAKLGLDWSKLRQRVKLVEELKRSLTLRASQVPIELLEGIWRSLSGMQHGYAYALVEHSDLELRVPVPGGQLVTVTINDERLEAIALASMWMLWEAVGRYIRLSTRT